MDNRLLHTPEGVRDIYGNEFLKKNHIEQELIKVAKSYGYKGISTPTFEYFDVFSKEVGTIPSRELFKFFDKENNTLVLRPDFTPSICRSTAGYFKDSDKPLRFYYKGNVFINTSDHQGKLKEMTQLGMEFFGDASVAADGEVISFVANALKSSGLNDFQITIGESEFFKGICEAAGIDVETELELRESISNKNIFKVRAISESLSISDKVKDAILNVSDLFGGIEILKTAKSVTDNARSLAAIERLEKLYEVLKLYGVEEYISFDLSMLSKYHYYTGITFAAYSYGVGEVICKGGRYDNLLKHFGKDYPAIGAVIMTDVLMNALRAQENEPQIVDRTDVLVYNDDVLSIAISAAMEMRKEGRKVELIRQEGNKDNIPADLQGISGNIYVIADGKVVLYNE